MAPPNNTSVVRVAFVMARDTRQIVNTIHVSDASGWDFTQMVDLATRMKTWWDTYYKPMVPSQYSLTQIQVRLYNPVAPLAYDLNVSPPIAGTRTGSAEPGQVSLSMSERTGLAGRKYRGRMYLAGVSNNDVTISDTVISALLSLASAAMANLILNVVTGTEEIAIFHRNTNTYTEVISWVIENILDSQRRRLPGRGR